MGNGGNIYRKMRGPEWAYGLVMVLKVVQRVGFQLGLVGFKRFFRASTNSREEMGQIGQGGPTHGVV